MNKSENEIPELLVINLWSGPGTGKSTILAGLYYELSRRCHKAEMIAEDPKKYGEEKTAYLRTAELHHRLEKQRGKVEFAITDFPLPLGIYYDPSKSINLRGLAMELYKSFNNLNFYIEREPGARVGEEALAIDKDIKNILNSSNIPFISIPSRDPIPHILDAISEYKCREKLKKEGDLGEYNLDPSEEI